MTMPLLLLSAFTKRYASLLALNQIDFRLDAGEVVGLVGRRGAGKTSLLHALAGIAPHTSGEMTFRGKRIYRLTPGQARSEGIELVSQVSHLNEELDVLGNIFLGREICWPKPYGLPDWGAMVRRARQLLATFDLPASLLNERTGNLSDELRQVTAIGRALCAQPHLLLFDQSLDSLSFPRQQTLLEEIRRLGDEGTGTVISSDNLKHLFAVTHRILVLYEGRLIADVKTSECTPRDIVELMVGTSSREQVTPIVWALESFHAAQRQTEELVRARTSLHQSLEASDSLNRQLVKRLSDQVKALDRLNRTLQETQRRLLTESEEERKSLARELHDQVIQDMLGYNYRLEEVESSLMSEDERAELDSIRSGLRNVIGDLRQLCSDLRPPTIDNHGLTSAIRSLAHEWAERCGLRLRLEIDPQLGRLPEAIELSVFRIVQEGLNNIRKHANAHEVELSLHRTPMDSLLVRLADDGLGTPNPPNLSELSKGKHFGLLGISERAALLGGAMRIDSPPDGGMILEVEIPSPYPSTYSKEERVKDEG